MYKKFIGFRYNSEHGPVGARWVAVKLVDSLRTLEVGPRDLLLPCRDRRLIQFWC